jgi:hypothetical protein
MIRDGFTLPGWVAALSKTTADEEDEISREQEQERMKTMKEMEEKRKI